MSTFPQPQHKFVPALRFGTVYIHDYEYLHGDHRSGLLDSENLRVLATLWIQKFCKMFFKSRIGLNCGSMKMMDPSSVLV